MIQPSKLLNDMHLTIEFKDIPELKRKLKTLCVDFGLDGMTLEDFKNSGPMMVADVRLPRWIRNALKKANISRLSQLEKITASKFVKISGLGYAALREVNELLSEYNLRTIDN